MEWLALPQRPAASVIAHQGCAHAHTYHRLSCPAAPHLAHAKGAHVLHLHHLTHAHHHVVLGIAAASAVLAGAVVPPSLCLALRQRRVACACVCAAHSCMSVVLLYAVGARSAASCCAGGGQLLLLRRWRPGPAGHAGLRSVRTQHSGQQLRRCQRLKQARLKLRAQLQVYRGGGDRVGLRVTAALIATVAVAAAPATFNTATTAVRSALSA